MSWRQWLYDIGLYGLFSDVGSLSSDRHKAAGKAEALNAGDPKRIQDVYNMMSKEGDSL